MTYQAEISRANPTCFLFLIDQSTSMMEPIMGVPGNPRKAEFVADALNRVIQNLVVLASKDVEVRNYYQIGVIGYGSTVGPALGGNLTGKELVWVEEIYSNPLRVEDRVKKESDGAGGFIEVNTKFPVWFDPVANGNTPMCQALKLAESVLSKWVDENRMSFPPTVINLTDGEANDGDPREPAEAIKALSTSDGNVIFLTLHASSNNAFQPAVFPNNTEVLPNDAAKVMFEMSSTLPEHMHKYAEELSEQSFAEGAKGIVYNAGIAEIVRALDIGTRPANLR
jgi:hypothetical protein